MRRNVVLALGLLVATAAFAAPPQELTEPRVSSRHTPWVEPVAMTEEEIELAAAAAATSTQGTWPVVLLETNFYAFLPGEKLQLRLTTHPNGWTAPVTLYLYWQDRVTGAKRYYSVPGGGLQAVGVIADLFGTPGGSPVPVNVPILNDFVLFGSAADPALLSWGIDGALGPSLTAAAQPGLYQFVLEVRDAAGRAVVAKSNAMYSFVTAQELVRGEITQNITWRATKRYVLSDFVLVREPAVLTIEPGTVILGGDTRATLFITKGAKIVADGTAMRPIVFTSAKKVGERAQRDWGGVVLFGRAPINEPGGQAYLEGMPSQPQFAFGGTDPHDNSGVIRYVRLEFGGYEIEVNQEINGLTLGGVGDGTVIEYLQVHFNKDDSIEFFGGTVNAKYLLFTSNADDGIDYDLGWQGNIQYVVAVKTTINDENDSNFGGEGDNHPQNFDLTPRSNPQIYNVTAIGTGSQTVGNYGWVLRRGVAGKHHNVLIYGSRQAPVTVRDDATFNQIATGELVFDNSILFGDFSDAKFPNSRDKAAQTRQFLFETMKFNRNVDPMLAFGTWAPYKFYNPNVMPLPGSPALDISYVKTPPDNGFFDTSVNCIGGVCPGNDWLSTGWAIFSDN
jgi:hypothetical protein